MGKKMTRAGMVLRRAVRADIDAKPTIDHLKIRSKHGVAEGIIESALTKNIAEWDALIVATPDDAPVVHRPKRAPASAVSETPSPPAATRGEATKVPTAAAAMPGLEQGVVKFTRKPAKMGTDYIFWVPRVYVKNGLVDPRTEYEVYLKKRA